MKSSRQSQHGSILHACIIGSGRPPYHIILMVMIRRYHGTYDGMICNNNETMRYGSGIEIHSSFYSSIILSPYRLSLYCTYPYCTYRTYRTADQSLYQVMIHDRVHIPLLQAQNALIPHHVHAQYLVMFEATSINRHGRSTCSVDCTVVLGTRYSVLGMHKFVPTTYSTRSSPSE